MQSDAIAGVHRLISNGCHIDGIERVGASRTVSSDHCSIGYVFIVANGSCEERQRDHDRCGILQSIDQFGDVRHAAATGTGQVPSKEIQLCSCRGLHAVGPRKSFEELTGSIAEAVQYTVIRTGSDSERRAQTFVACAVQCRHRARISIARCLEEDALNERKGYSVHLRNGRDQKVEDLRPHPIEK